MTVPVKPAPQLRSAQPSLGLSLRPSLLQDRKANAESVPPEPASMPEGLWTGQDRAPAVLRQRRGAISLIKSGGGASLFAGGRRVGEK